MINRVTLLLIRFRWLKINCKIDENESQVSEAINLHGVNSEDKATPLDLNEIASLDQLIRKYLKLKSIIDRILDASEQQQLVGGNDEDVEMLAKQQALPSFSSSFSSLYYPSNSLIGLNERPRSSKRSGSSVDAYEKFIKGKRVNKNMFSSGLQGVWGVPGRKWTISIIIIIIIVVLRIFYFSSFLLFINKSFLEFPISLKKLCLNKFI